MSSPTSRPQHESAPPVSVLATGARGLLRVLSSYGLASGLFLCLLLLTYLGTLDQVERGLHHAQQKYFHSFVVVQALGPLAILLPGAYAVMALLLVNIVLGVLLRMRKGWAQAGMLMVHGGVVVLLLGAFVSFHYAVNGSMTIREGETAQAFTSEDGWELVVEGPAAESQLTIPGSEFIHLRGEEVKRVAVAGAPFALELHHYYRHAAPAPPGPMVAPASPVVEGTYLQPLPPAKERAQEAAGVYARVIPENGGAPVEQILWGGNPEPVSEATPEGTWRLGLRRQQIELPFSLGLERFQRELHPGTDLPKAFSSEITRTDGEIRERALISMNAPMRYQGYTFYQSSWGPQDAAPGVPLYSVLAVARNPAERFPLYACAIIAAGMALHFALKLTRYLRRESAGRGRV
jgi:hypothetical protein